MRNSYIPLSLLLMAVLCQPCPSEDWDARLEIQVKESTFVVLGRIESISSLTHPDAKTVAVGRMKVRRHLKGASKVRNLGVEFHFESFLELKPDSKDYIWFIGPKLDNGRYLITNWRWGRDSIERIMAVISKVDKNTRIPNMREPLQADTAITVSLAVEDEQGHALTYARAHSLRQIRLWAQFHNRSKVPLSILHRSFLYDTLEIVGPDGRRISRFSELCCGDLLILRKEHIVQIGPNEVYRRILWTTGFRLAPGIYRARYKYTATQDLSSAAMIFNRGDEKLRQLLNNVWEGEIVSNWIEIEIPDVVTEDRDLGIRRVYQGLAIPTQELMDSDPTYANLLLRQADAAAPTLNVSHGDASAEEFGRLLLAEYPDYFTTGAWLLAHAGVPDVEQLVNERIDDLMRLGHQRHIALFDKKVQELLRVLTRINEEQAKSRMIEIISGYKGEHPYLKVNLAIELFKLGDRYGLDAIFSQMVDPEMESSYRASIAHKMEGAFRFHWQGGDTWEGHLKKRASWYAANKDRLIWDEGIRFENDEPGEAYQQSIRAYMSEQEK